MAKLDSLLAQMVQRRASDLHLSTGEPIRMRIDGELAAVADRRLSEEEMVGLLEEICSAEQWSRFKQNWDLDFAYGLPGISRFRCNFLREVRGTGAVFRVIPEKILTMEDLCLPEQVCRFADIESGLVLVTGPTGSGKSTTLASIIDAINKRMAHNIITIEDPIEFVHKDQRSYIAQREIGQHSPSFAAALKDALSEDPDVLLVGEMRDLETISLAVTAAEMGVLVFGTLHTNSAAKTVDRIIDVFPKSQKEQIRGMLAESLRGILAQQLLRKKEGGRIAAIEVLSSGQGLPAIIRDGTASKIQTFIESNRSTGMQTMDAVLMDFVDKNLVSPQEAFLKSNDKKRFERFLLDKGIETSAAAS
ncbi:MAG: type IV pilus twitching motility protein PilT [Myxococcota bacterium]|jgi:twitching motility protein PilT|nr:type IV pilus twitching motility protein PilT [Myxococcota bacterium]